MLRFTVALLCLAAINAQPIDESPKPYSFSYEAVGEDGGQSSRSESGDGSGTVIGTYSLSNPDGTSRTVSYTAGPDGFKASVDTNEPGTGPESPADVELRSNPIDVAPAPVSVSAPVPAIRAPVRIAPAPLTYIRPAPVQPQRSRYVVVPVDALGGYGGLGSYGGYPAPFY